MMPVARDPTAIRGRNTPDTTDPDVIFSFVVPGPVAGNPENVFPLGFIFRRNFTDRFWRGVRYQGTGIRVIVNLLSKCLVDGTSC